MREPHPLLSIPAPFDEQTGSTSFTKSEGVARPKARVGQAAPDDEHPITATACIHASARALTPRCTPSAHEKPNDLQP